MESEGYCEGEHTCYTSQGLTVCPYCKVTTYHLPPGHQVYRGEEEVGEYTGGKGDFQAEEAMVFRGR